MSVKQNLALLRLLAANPLLTEREARRELGLPETPPDREDRREPKQDDDSDDKPTVNLSASPAAAA